MAWDDWAIWWLSQQDALRVETLGQGGAIEEHEFPSYVFNEFADVSGCVRASGRGRLWIPDECKGCPQDVPFTQNNAVCDAVGNAAGIVIKAEDVKLILPLPGFVTDFRMKLWRR